MFWAACSLGYFGFLLASEFTVPSLASFSPSLHLGVQDIAVDSLSTPSCMRVKIKGLKTDPFRKGAFIHIGRGRPPICAVHSEISYLASRGDRSGPLFLFRNGLPLSRAVLTDWLRQIQATFLATASASVLPLWRLATEFQITLLKPWAAGRVLLIKCTLGPRRNL